MAAASLSFIFGILGNIISILVFASPIKTFVGVVKKKSTENYNGTPYITTLLSTSLWTFYGLMKPELLVSTVNGAGAVFQFIYVTLFLIYGPKHKKATMIKLVGLLNIASLGMVIAITFLALHGGIRITFLGILCCGLTIGMYASPLVAMRTVIMTKSVEYMPFLLSFFLFLNAGVWSTYAVLVKDIYIGVPNSIGFALGSAQLIIYMIYKNKSKSTESTEEMEEEGSAHLIKEGIAMRVFDDEDGGANQTNRSLHKGTSLPKPSITREYSTHKIMRALSFGPFELHSSWSQGQQDDVENGKKDHP